MTDTINSQGEFHAEPFRYESQIALSSPAAVVPVTFHDRLFAEQSIHSWGDVWLSHKLADKGNLEKLYRADTNPLRAIDSGELRLRVFASALWFAVLRRVEKEVPRCYGTISKDDHFYDVIVLDRLEQRLDNFWLHFDFFPENKRFVRELKAHLMDFHRFMILNGPLYGQSLTDNAHHYYTLLDARADPLSYAA